jgi:hypothetical protein
MGKKNLQRFLVTPGNVSGAIVDLDRFQKKARDILNSRRLVVYPSEKSITPEDGELLFDGNSLFVAVEGEYTKLAFVTEDTSRGVPQWFADYLANQEKLMKGSGISESEFSELGGL